MLHNNLSVRPAAKRFGASAAIRVAPLAPPVTLGLAAVLAVAAGCRGPAANGSRSVTTEAFADTQQQQPTRPAILVGQPDDASSETTAAASPEVVVLGTPDRAAPRIIDVEQARGSAGYLPPSEGAGATPPMVQLGNPSQTPLLVNAKVGDINGRPVFAGDFLEPLAPLLRAAASNPELDAQQWRAEATRVISDQLREQIENELLRAEAVSTLAPDQQRFGVGALLNRLREGAGRRAGGNIPLAQREIEQREGISFDEYLEAQRDEQLVRFLLQQRIDRRVSVSWREIQQDYETRYDEFNPNPRAVFRVIRVRRSNEDDVATIRAALAAGTPFEEVASLPANGSNAEDGGLFVFEFEGELAGAEPFRQEAFNAAAVALAPGEIAGPIVDDRFIRWVMLERIAELSIPLYEAQLYLDAVRRQQLRREEFVQYYASLRDQASFTDTELMVDRLVQIAEAQFRPGP